MRGEDKKRSLVIRVGGPRRPGRLDGGGLFRLQKRLIRVSKRQGHKGNRPLTKLGGRSESCHWERGRTDQRLWQMAAVPVRTLTHTDNNGSHSALKQSKAWQCHRNGGNR